MDDELTASKMNSDLLAARAPWLLSHYNDRVWRFRNDNPAARESGNKVNWGNPDSSTGECLTDTKAGQLLATCKAYVVALDHEGLYVDRSKWSTIRSKALRVSVIGRLVLSIGHYSFHSLTRADLLKFMCSLAERPGHNKKNGFVSNIVRRQYNTVLFELYHFSQEGIISLGINIDPRPLTNETSLKPRTIKEIKRGTPRIPEYIARSLLNTSITWLEQINIELATCKRISRADIILQVKLFIDERLKQVKGRRPPSLEIAMTICFIIVAAFTGFRISEQLTVSQKGLSKSRSGHSIQSRVRKTSKRVAGTLTVRPIPPIVRTAIVFAEKIGASESGDGSAIFRLLKKDGSLQLNDAPKWADRINRFSQIAGVPLFVVDGFSSPWHFTAQQFRRFFALFYVRRYSGPLDPLRDHFRHVTADMILHYTDDPDTARFLMEEKYEFTSELMELIANGELNATGAFGNMLSNLGASYRAKSLTPQQIKSMVMEWIDEEKLELVATPYGLCASSRARAALAVCGGGTDGLPNITRRTMDGCFVCPNGCQTEEDIPALRVEYLVHKDVAESIRDGPIHEIAIDRMKKIKIILLALEKAK